MWLACARIGRPATFALNVLASKSLGREVLNPHAFLLRDIVMQTEDGVFHCRRKSSDFGVCSVTHERSYRPFFEMDYGVFVDIGANIGKWSISVARKLGPRGKVIAVEAEPETFEVLRRNIEANGLTNVVAVWAACSDSNGPRPLFCHPWAQGFHTTDPGGAARLQSSDEFGESSGRRRVVVPGRTLDSILEAMAVPAVDLVKIDVEGGEMAVLRGAVHTLKLNPALRIIVEASSDEPLAFLTDRGFTVSRIGFRDYVAERKNGAPLQKSGEAD